MESKMRENGGREMSRKRHPPSQSKRKTLYLPEWGLIQTVADRLSQNRIGGGVRVGGVIRAALRGFYRLSNAEQDKMLKSAEFKG